MKQQLAALLSGFVFALGLGISGMTLPSKVVGFLDVAGAWDPSLAFVMVGAIGVHLVGHRLAMRRATPLFDATFHLPAARKVDARLVGGAALFGVGWGLAGYCPGPAIVSLVSGVPAVLVSVASMAVGTIVYDRLAARPAAPPVAAPAAEA